MTKKQAVAAVQKDLEDLKVEMHALIATPDVELQAEYERLWGLAHGFLEYLENNPDLSGAQIGMLYGDYLFDKSHPPKK